MSNPTCPHCSYEFDDEETWCVSHGDSDVYTGDGDISELTCHNDDCKKQFHIVCVHDIRFAACDENGNDL
jgi:hypothetical protein